MRGTIRPGLFWSLVLAAAAAAVYFFQKANTSSALTQQSPTLSSSTERALSENGNPRRSTKGNALPFPPSLPCAAERVAGPPGD
ncbi:hypothetical protein BMJ34_25900 [Sinorhizobium medicae]|uniref:Uncharacterized protein n=1 Tax=Sinorhizobium medicae TaxID=110321 RepID=A0ABX4TT72_9HYPH|nr:hypothetical protein BMJ34_25900 [Sinorhizobium medicae]PLU10044.1 hypothetical protein BMJ33_00150 [Sinorhizobium medicae]PLU17214.1 hypothetical protein BMJ29_21700 [Sinorhizobium medicae]PLU18636.1 hypothetical protein BMJ30_12885 [Sinorhizobium medicae]PLU37036.1 hypothetical protein BMJ26_17990 [Sinorhizobium medicae]